jgi:hypothetical protein
MQSALSFTTRATSSIRASVALAPLFVMVRERGLFHELLVEPPALDSGTHVLNQQPEGDARERKHQDGFGVISSNEITE